MPRAEAELGDPTESRSRRPDAAPEPVGRVYKYYDLIMAAFVTVLLCTNLISVGKRASIGGFVFGTGVLFFPISYLFGDVLTEVYGYKRSRKVVWAGFAALGFAAVLAKVVLILPADPSWPNQKIWETVFGGTWRIVIASILGFLCGEFTNSFTLAKLKVFTKGQFLWVRTISSTIVGELADSLVFYPIAFLGVEGWTPARVLQILVTNYALKVAWEVIATPMTYKVVAFLKRVEGEDYYDDHTNFTPFSLET